MWFPRGGLPTYTDPGIIRGSQSLVSHAAQWRGQESLLPTDTSRVMTDPALQLKPQPMSHCRL